MHPSTALLEGNLPDYANLPTRFHLPPLRKNATKRVAPFESKSATKRVTMMPKVTVFPVDRIGEEHKADVFCTNAELKRMAKEAKSMTEKLTAACPVQKTSAQADPVYRGMELYLCPHRARNKIVANKTILKYGRHLRGSNKTDEEKAQSLALCSSKLTKWAAQVAVASARHDALAAYSTDYLIPIDEPVEVEEFIGVRTKRERRESRRVTVDDEEEEFVPAFKRRRVE
mmetsp:Transcript_32899/g.78577  ORF Transcript_32899/g.78577 Transcript_32899/m.78577 type:complete len:229 (+) Transcript_32899:91-777(+)